MYRNTNASLFQGRASNAATQSDHPTGVARHHHFERRAASTADATDGANEELVNTGETAKRLSGLLTQKQLAEILGVSERTLERWRVDPWQVASSPPEPDIAVGTRDRGVTVLQTGISSELCVAATTI